MKFQKLKIQNYGSFNGLHEFDLADRGLVLVLGENNDEPRANANGAGKSTLFEALDWCITGEVPRGDHVDSIINEIAGKDCQVSVAVTADNGESGEIARYRKFGKKNGPTFAVGGVDRTALDASETQKWIDEWLGLDRDIFHASIFFAQGDTWRFADGTDAERVAVLTRVLQLGEIDTWLEKAKGLQAATSAEIGKRSMVLDKIAVEVGVLEKMDLAKQSEDWELERRRKIAELLLQIASLRTQLAGLRDLASSLPRLDARFAAINQQAPVPPQGLEFPEELTQLQARLESEMQVSERTASNLRADLAEFDLTGLGRCPKCRQQVSVDHLAEEKKKMMVEINACEAARPELSAKLAEIGKSRAQAREKKIEAERQYKETVRAYNDQRNQLGVAMDQARRADDQCAFTGALIQNAEKEIVSLQKAQDPFLKKQAEILDQIAALHRQGEQAGCELDEIKDREERIGFWVEAFGPKGLKNYILDTRLQEMTEAANHWIKLLTGGTFWIRFETQTKGRSGSLSNKINIRVFQYAKDGRVVERNYKSWSGGQKARVSMGIDFGLSRLVAARAKNKHGLLILDEAFKHLDRAGKEAVVEMLHELQKEKSSVFVIDHDSDFQAAFENVVTVQYKNQCSIIREWAVSSGA